MQKPLLQMTAEVGKIMKSVQCDITFTFIELSETPKISVKIPVVLEIKKVLVSQRRIFIENEAARKRVKMRKRSTLVKTTNWQLSFLYQLWRFQNNKKNCGTFFIRHLHENEVLHTLTFYMKINDFNSVFRTT